MADEQNDELTERDRIPERLPEARRDTATPSDGPDDESVPPDAKPLAGQEPG